MTRRRGILIGVATLVVAACACGGPGSSDPENAREGSAAASAPEEKPERSREKSTVGTSPGRAQRAGGGSGSSQSGVSLPRAATYVYDVIRTGSMLYGGEAQPAFEDRVTHQATVRAHGPGARTLSWSPYSTGDNPDDIQDHKITSDAEGIHGTFLTSYAGAIPSSAWDTPPLFVPENPIQGQPWSGTSRGVGDRGGSPTADRLTISSQLVGEKSLDFHGSPERVLELSREWTFRRTYAQKSRTFDGSIASTQVELFAPRLGLVLCSRSDSAWEGGPDSGSKYHYRARIEGVEACPGH